MSCHQPRQWNIRVWDGVFIYPSQRKKVAFLKNLNNGLHFARKDRGIKNWCALVCSDVLLNAFVEQMLSLHHFLVHNLAWAHPRGLDITNILLKNKKRFTPGSATLRSPERQPPSRSGSGPRQTEPSIFSTSSTFWCVVYRQVWNGTATPALHLTLPDSARCGVSSPEPERLWRWPWL